MKKILNSLMLLAVLTGTLHAECSKAEVMKLIDKGFRKAEIASICEITAKSKTTHTAPKSKWITPINKVCRANGGKLHKGVCSAKWSDAKAICRASDGRLPIKRELIQVVDECGGNTANTHSAYDENREDPNYQACYKRKGFSFDSYWSSTTNADFEYLAAWGVHFDYGSVVGYNKSSNLYVRCVSAGQ